MKICTVEGCNNIHFSKNFCDKHYRRYKKYGNPLIDNKTKFIKCQIGGCHEPHYCKKKCKKHYEAMPIYRYKRAKRSCKNREFTLTFEQYCLITENSNCIYCDAPKGMTCGSFLDRVDSKLGYTLDNVVPCCDFCNSIKCNLLSFYEMKEIAKLLKSIRSSTRQL